MVQAARSRKIFDDRYEILSIIGRGSASVVYHARHVLAQGTEVALKVLLERKELGSTAELLKREAMAMISSRHKFVIRLDDYRTVGDLAYLAMEYAPQSDLRAYVRNNGGKLDAIRGQLFFAQAAEALNFTHQAGVVHRDMKPDNILVVNEQECRLCDYGLALLPGSETSLDDLKRGIGTMAYMPPEMLEGKAYDQKSDIYGLALSFYEMLSGAHPFENAPLMQQLEARKDGAFPALSDVRKDLPAGFADVIMKGLRYNPGDRFGTAQEMVKAIVAAASAGPLQTQAQPAAAPKTEKSRFRLSFSAKKKAGEEAATKEDKNFIMGTDNKKDEAQGKARVSPHKGIHQVEPVFPGAHAHLDGGTERTLSIPPQAVRNLRASAKKAQTGKTADKPADLSAWSRRDPLKSFMLTAAIGVFLFLLLTVVSDEVNEFGQRYLHLNARNLVAGEGEPSPVPSYGGEELSFPHIPGGLYQGSIQGLLPGRNLPLSIVSFNTPRRLVFLVGLAGWTPAVVSLDAVSADDPRLQVRANGLILDLTGQNVDGELMGYFKNIITGDQGEWRVKPVK